MGVGVNEGVHVDEDHISEAATTAEQIVVTESTTTTIVVSNLYLSFTF